MNVLWKALQKRPEWRDGEDRWKKNVTIIASYPVRVTRLRKKKSRQHLLNKRSRRRGRAAKTIGWIIDHYGDDGFVIAVMTGQSWQDGSSNNALNGFAQTRHIDPAIMTPAPLELFPRGLNKATEKLAITGPGSMTPLPEKLDLGSGEK